MLRAAETRTTEPSIHLLDPGLVVAVARSGPYERDAAIGAVSDRRQLMKAPFDTRRCAEILDGGNQWN